MVAGGFVSGFHVEWGSGGAFFEVAVDFDSLAAGIVKEEFFDCMWVAVEVVDDAFVLGEELIEKCRVGSDGFVADSEGGEF